MKIYWCACFDSIYYLNPLGQVLILQTGMRQITEDEFEEEYYWRETSITKEFILGKYNGSFEYIGRI